MEVLQKQLKINKMKWINCFSRYVILIGTAGSSFLSLPKVIF